VPIGGHRSIKGYASCLAAPGKVDACDGSDRETWTLTSNLALRSPDRRCLAVAHGKPVLQACGRGKAQRWRHTLEGNLAAAGRQCLSAVGPDDSTRMLRMQPRGHNQPNPIWSLPN